MQQSHTFASRYKPAHRPKLAKECACPAQEEIQNIFSTASKKLKHPTPKLTMQTAETFGLVNWTTEAHAHNSGFKKLAVHWLTQVQFFNQTFVQVDTFVLRNRQLLKPAKRCALAKQ